ncbi:hypothetical protein DOTSEDRAFT_39536 [Dothistroma septosporum NZE10]|uniref:Uncharacterized protein n=1 Tax=Dothistroma septosporum (strain NZE10 / CBS 128990) TaxID=675120 RepID=N1PCJ1_DOTSN|nr:hypothetical protein DOTSEDRAFT_39536 [Dothistroma septosporum NZE10]
MSHIRSKAAKQAPADPTITKQRGSSLRHQQTSYANTKANHPSTKCIASRRLTKHSHSRQRVMSKYQIQNQTEIAKDKVTKASEVQYNIINHAKRATDSNIKLSLGNTFTSHLLTHIKDPTCTWPTLETVLLDPAYRYDDLCPASDLIAALEVTFEVFTIAKDELTKVLEGVEGFKVKRTPRQLKLMAKQYEAYMMPRLEDAKGKEENTLSKTELRRWIMWYMSAKDGVLEDLARWRKACGIEQVK